MRVRSLRILQLESGQIVAKKEWMADEATSGHEEKMKGWQP
jgi:hypothetical protein